MEAGEPGFGTWARRAGHESDPEKRALVQPRRGMLMLGGQWGRRQVRQGKVCQRAGTCGASDLLVKVCLRL